MTEEEGFVEVPGGRVWFRSVGESAGGRAPLLCLHGGPGFTHNYLEPLEALADRRRVIFYDQLGCGQSDRPDDLSLWTVERFVEEVAQVRAAFGLARLHLFGSSWGGMLAMQYVLDRQPDLGSLTLCGSPASMIRWVADCGELLAAEPAEIRQVIREHEAAGTTACPEYQAESSHAGGATLPSWSNFTLHGVVGGVGGFKGLAEAAVVCGFLYLGWEATSVLGEESTKQKINPGRAMMMGTGFLTVWYTFLIIVFQGVSSQKDVLAHGTDVLAYAGTLLVPGFLGRALPLAVLIAVLGTSQIQMVEPSRVLFAMARDRLIPRFFGFLGRKHQTPWASMILLAAIPPLLLIPYLASSSATKAIGYVISASGMLGLFMYFVIALSSVWFYRSELSRSLGTALVRGVLPLIGGLFMGLIFFYGLTTQAPAVAWVSVAGVALVYVLGVVVWLVAPRGARRGDNGRTEPG